MEPVDIRTTRGMHLDPDLTSSHTTQFIYRLYRECHVRLQHIKPQSAYVNNKEGKEDDTSEACVGRLREIERVTTKANGKQKEKAEERCVTDRKTAAQATQGERDGGDSGLISDQD